MTTYDDSDVIITGEPQPVTDTLTDALESLVDQFTLRTVLERLADVCDAKADHVQSAWQDSALAGCWAKARYNVMKIASLL
jgi:hypothetical protein